jgi:hypothetical protein
MGKLRDWSPEIKEILDDKFKNLPLKELEDDYLRLREGYEMEGCLSRKGRLLCIEFEKRLIKHREFYERTIQGLFQEIEEKMETK